MKAVKIFVTQSGNTLDSHHQFLKRLSHHRKFKVREVHECDVILAFCPIVSRVGTDIEAALRIFKGYSTPSKPIIVVVLHHTYEKDEVVPDSKKYESAEIRIVNSLFHETEGLLKNCKLNSDAINSTSQKLKEFKKKSKDPEKNKGGNTENNKKTKKGKREKKKEKTDKTRTDTGRNTEGVSLQMEASRENTAGNTFSEGESQKGKPRGRKKTKMCLIL